MERVAQKVDPKTAEARIQRYAQHFARGGEMRVLAEIEQLDPQYLRLWINCNMPFAALGTKGRLKDRTAARMARCREHLGWDQHNETTAKTPRCRYYIAAQRTECGAPCTGQYCATHQAYLHPLGREAADEVKNARLRPMDAFSVGAV